jgi:hypothetical protein
MTTPRSKFATALLAATLLVPALAFAADTPAAPAAPAKPAAPAAMAQAAPTVNSCMDCHRKEEPRLAAPTKHFESDIHFQRGFSCVDCHGGDPKDPDITAMDPDKGYIGKPTRAEIPLMCTKCHADPVFMKRFRPEPYVFSMAEFKSSVHGRKLFEGDKKVATCTSCHGVHGILAHKDPNSPVYKTNVPRTCATCHNAEYMAGRKIPTNQFSDYQKSVHGRALLEKGDLSAPACNDCHGNHGAVPPNTRDISTVCGNCHGREGELFASSKVSERLQVEHKRGCVTCHGNHGVQRPTDAMIGFDAGGVCGQCHESGSAGDKASMKIVAEFHGLKDRIQTSDSLLTYAGRLGMPTDKGRESLKQAQDMVVNSRAAMHSFDGKQILGGIAEGAGNADKALDYARHALKDWRTRRVGMGASVIAIVALILLLSLKIRQVDRDSNAPDPNQP